MWFELKVDRFEDVWIRVALPDRRWPYLCTLYISPFNGNTYLYEAFRSKFTSNYQELGPEDELLFLGDFNCPQLNEFFVINPGDTSTLSGVGRDGSAVLDVVALAG